MNSKGLFKATPEGFTPFDRRARDLHTKLFNRHDGKPVFFTIRSARNPEHSRLAHAVFSKLADGLGVSIEAVKAWLKEETGRFDLCRMPDGKIVKIRHSVSFSAMSQEDFASFWNDCLPIIYEKLLGGMPSKEYSEIVEILSGKRDAD